MTNNYLLSNLSKSTLIDSKITAEPEGLILSPFQRKLLQKNIKDNLRPEYARRINIMLMADLGHSQTEICTALNCSQETARYWISIARSGQAHNWSQEKIGRPNKISSEYLQRLEELVAKSPRECGYAFGRWTAYWLSKQLEKEFEVVVSDRHINRLLKKMGLSTRSQKSQNDQQTPEKPPRNTRIVIENIYPTSAEKSSSSPDFSPNFFDHLINSN
jgi:transposase